MITSATGCWCFSIRRAIRWGRVTTSPNRRSRSVQAACFGKGFGQGSQSHLDYLPEAHTDFVFATMAEEWGLLGGLFVLIVFALILRWGFTTARNAPDRFSGLLAGGMTCTVFFYIAINLMMVMGLAPVVGIPLPFMSHGGSSMMTNMICLGTIMAVDRWSRKGGLQGS
jgi:rod shape determining protein RodA